MCGIKNGLSSNGYTCERGYHDGIPAICNHDNDLWGMSVDPGFMPNDALLTSNASKYSYYTFPSQRYRHGPEADGRDRTFELYHRMCCETPLHILTLAPRKDSQHVYTRASMFGDLLADGANPSRPLLVQDL